MITIEEAESKKKKKYTPKKDWISVPKITIFLISDE